MDSLLFSDLKKLYPKQYTWDTYYKFEDEVEERKKKERKGEEEDSGWNDDEWFYI